MGLSGATFVLETTSTAGRVVQERDDSNMRTNTSGATEQPISRVVHNVELGPEARATGGKAAGGAATDFDDVVGQDDVFRDKSTEQWRDRAVAIALGGVHDIAIGGSVDPFELDNSNGHSTYLRQR